MSEYKIPGVYIEEQSVFPPSVSPLSTAVPVFLGYTSLEVDEPQKIQSLMEFEAIFGPPPTSTGPVVEFPNGMDSGEPTFNWGAAKSFHLYYYVEHYFKNGGGACYVISTGVAGKEYPSSGAAYSEALTELKKLDEPTLIVLTDALATLEGTGDYAARNAAYFGLVQEAMQQCGELKDRFVIVDMPDAKNDLIQATSDFRTAINANQSYAAAYYPYLETSLSRRPVFTFTKNVWTDNNLAGNEPKNFSSFVDTNSNKLPIVSYHGVLTPTITLVQEVGTEKGIAMSVVVDGQNVELAITLTKIDDQSRFSAKELLDAFNLLADKGGFELNDNSQGNPTTSYLVWRFTAPTLVEIPEAGKIDELKRHHPGLFTRISNAIAKVPLRLPPAPAMAGVYASVDRQRGVWKAPANVGLAATTTTSVRLSQDDQAFLDIDETQGKSVNCILHFTGKGVIPWGARTLDASNLDWRYISVRRLFMMAEESIKKAARFAVFEPNDKNTWSKVKAMINNYLASLWQQGALMGAKPEQAFFVRVGLGESMTFQDVLDGRMIVQVGMAPVHPAEFIVLRFSQMQQTS